MGDEGLETCLEGFGAGLDDGGVSCEHLALDGWMAERSDGPAYGKEDEAPWHEMRGDEHECRGHD